MTPRLVRLSRASSAPFRNSLIAMRLALAAALVVPVVCVGLGGCASGFESDGFMDPSKVGRWEKTPTSVPILRRLASIEGPEDEFVEPTDVTGTDLIPEIQPYHISPGDTMLITIWNFPQEGRMSEYERQVDARGVIELPQLGEIAMAGLTVDAAKAVLAQTMKDKELVDEPVLDIVLGQQRALRFSILGAVNQPGPYFIPEADFRLLEALTAASGVSESPEYIYVIRQIPLSDTARGARPGTPPPGEKPPEGGQELIDMINQLVEPKPQPPAGAPGVLGAGQPETQPVRPPPINLPDAQPSGVSSNAQAPAPGDAAWMFLNGRWVRVSRSLLGEPEAPSTGQGPTAEQLVTQRVIRIPTRPLMAGDARYNIVIRPGDVVRVPPIPSGTIYIAGDAVRPGAYDLTEGLTIQRAIAAAGGLNAIAIPERVDIIRMVGHDRQATIRLNLRAVFSATQPDIYLKANDMVNIGTNFWATPLAVIRSGFRASYGFGFLLDRNFGNDVFGAPPVNAFGG